MDSLPKLYAAVDIADACGVVPSAVTNWQRRGILPEPVMTVARGHTPLWSEEQTAEMVATRGARARAERLRQKADDLFRRAQDLERKAQEEEQDHCG